MMSERGHCGYSALGLWPREEQARLVTVAARDLHAAAKTLYQLRLVEALISVDAHYPGCALTTN